MEIEDAILIISSLDELERAFIAELEISLATGLAHLNYSRITTTIRKLTPHFIFTY